VNGLDRPSPAELAKAGTQVSWQVLPGWRELLLGPHGLRLAEWLNSGRAQIVKHGLRRTVYRVDLPERSIFLKHYRCPDLADAGRHLLRGSASRREYRKAIELARRQVPTIRPVAVGELHRSGLVADNFLITEAIPNAQSLHVYASETLPVLAPDQQHRLRRKLARALARLCAAAHEAGVFHDDFHGGNVLVRLDTCHGQAGDPRLPELYLVDLPGIRFSGPLNWRRSRQSLTMLSSDWGDKVSRSQRWLFWCTYLAERSGQLVRDRRAGARHLARLTRDYACRLMRGRAKRALRTNRDFYCLHTLAGRGHAVAQVAPPDLVRLLEDPERPLREAAEALAPRPQASTTVRTELSVSGQPMAVVYECWRQRAWWHALVQPLGRSRALAAWHHGHALLERGIGTPRPLAACLSRASARQSRAFLVSEWVDGAGTLEQLLQRAAQPGGQLGPAHARRLARALGALFGRLHAWRIVLDELSPADLLVVGQAEAAEVWVLNTLAVRFVRKLAPAEQLRQLARLLQDIGGRVPVTRSQCRRFLQEYRRELGESRAQERLWWKEITNAEV
jgi:tRNA A-37 threonylcarbamoyl transferase component Bud32